jgi:hypothetical protein
VSPVLTQSSSQCKTKHIMRDAMEVDNDDDCMIVECPPPELELPTMGHEVELKEVQMPCLAAAERDKIGPIFDVFTCVLFCKGGVLCVWACGRVGVWVRVQKRARKSGSFGTKRP